LPGIPGALKCGLSHESAGSENVYLAWGPPALGQGSWCISEPWGDSVGGVALDFGGSGGGSWLSVCWIRAGPILCQASGG